MRYVVAGLIVALVAAGLWEPDSPVAAQGDCVSEGAVSQGETELAADCETLLVARDTLLGADALHRAADTQAEEWASIRHYFEEVAALHPNSDTQAEDGISSKHYYEEPASLNWAANIPIEDWDGITVGGTPSRVVEIELTYERLSGTIPSELGDLSNLTNLHLGGNRLSGTIPPELGDLSNLGRLSIWGNELSGEIPAELGGLSNLTELYFSRNQLTGEIPHSLTRLTGLSTFYFIYNAGLCAPTDDAFRAWLQTIADVEGHPCDFAADRAVLVRFYNAADGVNWRYSYDWLSDRPMGNWDGVITDDEGRVTELDLIGNRLSGQIPPELGSLSKLQHVNFGGNSLSGPIPTELGDLSNLERLNLGQNQLSGPIPSELGELPSLISLHLDVNQLSGEIPTELGNLSNLEELVLADNQLSGPIPSELANLSRLEGLHLWSNQLSGQIPAALGNLTNMRSLHLDGNQLSGEIPPELGSLSKLAWLRLSENRLSGGIPSELGSLSNLLELSLQENQLSGEIPTELGDLSRLRSLHLSENQLTGELPESFVRLPLRRLAFYRNPTLCAPADEDFQSWLEGIDTVSGSSCAPVDSQEDKAVLALLYSATDGENWDDNSNWLSDLPIREWYGVTNDAEGRVTGLYLWENRLRGSIPPEMGDLSQLQRLYLQQNELTGQVPRSFLNLVNLTNLYFSDNAGLCAPVDKEFQSWLQGMGGAEGGSCNPVADLNALFRLYSATGGENWKDNSNWLTELPMREWYGVETDDEGHVTVLDLQWNGLSGTIPQEMGDLSNLEELDLDENKLSGTIPRELGSLANLTKLSLSYNKLTGEIPPELGNLPNLQELRLWRNELSETIPRELGSLANLTSLSLGGNEFTGEIPTVLGTLTGLEYLGLSDNQLAGTIPSQLSNLANLERLYLSDNQLAGTIPSQLGNLTNLERLYLSDNQLTGTIPRSFTGLTSLTRFEFLNNSGLCAPTDEVFQAWLQDIDIVYGEACDFAPDRDVLIRLYNATDGDNWEDSSNWLTDHPMGDWYGVSTDNTGRVTWLRLWDNRVTGSIPAELGSLSNLTELSLYDNQLSGEIPPELGSLSDLTNLSLHGNQLSGEIPPKLGSLSNLRWLSLGRNQLSGEIPTDLGSLSNLGWLYLYDNQLSGEIPSKLGSLFNLRWLSLGRNQLSGEIPDSLTGLTRLLRLEFFNNAGLCAPVNDSFQTWLQGIINVHGSSCASVDSEEDEAVLTLFYNSTDGANWENNSNWLSDRPMREWHGVTNDASGRVTGLYLWENQLSGSIPPELGNLVSLRYIYLYDNQLTGAIPLELGNLSNLRGLYLSDNQFNGCIPAALRSVVINDLDQLGLPFCGIPTVTISVDSASYQVRIDSPIIITATFSEPVSNFTVGDITVANGSTSNFASSDGDSVFTFDVTPNAVGVVTVDIAAGVAEDSDGNGNTAAVQLLLGLPYDDDRDGTIRLVEAIAAVRDYFGGNLRLEHAIAVVSLYFASL